jgi:hypothetical protein
MWAVVQSRFAGALETVRDATGGRGRPRSSGTSIDIR